MLFSADLVFIDGLVAFRCDLTEDSKRREAFDTQVVDSQGFCECVEQTFVFLQFAGYALRGNAGSQLLFQCVDRLVGFSQLFVSGCFFFD